MVRMRILACVTAPGRIRRVLAHSAELPCSAGDSHWSMSDGDLGALLRDSLARLGLPVRSAVVQVATRRLPQAYPIYERGYEERFAAIDRWLAGLPGVLTLGARASSPTTTRTTRSPWPTQR